MSLNKVMLIGNVGKDPEVRYLENNNGKVARFTLATTERYRDRNGELRENTEWHNLVAWRNSADIVEKFVKRGTQIYVEGKLTTRSWQDQSGNKRYSTEINVDNIQLLGKKSDNPAAQDGSRPQGGYQQSSGQNYQQGGYQQRSAQYSQPQPQFQQATAPEAIDINLDNGPQDDLPF